MILRIEKKLLLIVPVILLAILVPVGIAMTGNYIKTKNIVPQTLDSDDAGGTCGGGSGCGCGCGGSAKPRTQATTQQTGNKLQDAQNAAYKYYVDKYADANVEAKATDYGCHVGVDIIKDGQVVKQLGYSNGNIFES